MTDVEPIQKIQTVDGQRLTIGPKGVITSANSPIEAVDQQQIRTCLQWFGQTQPTPQPTVNSHWLTQFVQHWAGIPISNGALILAAAKAGFPIGRDHDNHTVNVTIGVSPQCINEFDCGCGPA